MRQYGDFIEYLMAKGEGGIIRAVEMDFEGKNVMLYYLGDGGGVGGGVTPKSVPEAFRRHVVRGPATAATWWALSGNNADNGRCCCRYSCASPHES